MRCEKRLIDTLLPISFFEKANFPTQYNTKIIEF